MAIKIIKHKKNQKNWLINFYVIAVVSFGLTQMA